jgi:hypothetical protein
MVKMLALFSLLISCVAPVEQEPAQTEIFTNKWWEMASGPAIPGLGDACFMLNDVYYHSGGTLISHEYGQEWPYYTYHGWWEYGEDESIVVISEMYEAVITPKGNRCWNVEYSIFNAVACECSYDTSDVDYFVD